MLVKDPSEVVDYHAHIVGHGDSGSGCVIHQKVREKGEEGEVGGGK